MAWIGVISSSTGALVPVTIAGHDDGYLAGARDICAEESVRHGPVGTTHKRPSTVCNDASVDPLMLPGRDRAIERGYRSCASFPLVVANELSGVLTLYSSVVNAFDDDTVGLFDEIATDVSCALDAINQGAGRVRREAGPLSVDGMNSVLIEHSFDVITIIESDATIRFVSPSVKRLLGYEQIELLGKNAFDFLHPEDTQATAAALEKGLASEGAVVSVEFRLRHKDGSWRWHEAIGRNLLHQSGFEGILINGWDVTRRKHAELARLAIERRYRSLVETTHDLVWTLNSRWRITYISPGAREILGRDPQEMMGQRMLAFVPSGERAAFRHVIERTTVHGEPAVDFESRILRADGSELILLSRAVAVRNADGIVAGMMGCSQDITERRRAEEALRLQGAAVVAAANGIVVTDLDGLVVWANPAVKELTGFGERELIGQNPRMLKSGVQDDAFYRNFWTTIKSGKTWRGEMTNRRKDGTLYEEDMTVSPIRNAAGKITHFVAIKQDVTQRKQTEENLRRSNAQLERAMCDLKTAETQNVQNERLRALGTMASGVAHDFNNALVPILGYSDVLLKHPEFLLDDKKTQRYLLSMNTAANDASKIVTRLRDFYRPREVGEAFTTVQLDQVAEEALALTEPRWKSQAAVAGVDIAVVAELLKVPAIAANATELREALTNLIFNAVDAMPGGGTLTVRTRAEGARVVVEVADTGMGMSEDVRQRCLEPFFTTKGDRGTGLGLSMVYGIVRRHEGVIEITSEAGRGAAIRLSFPSQESLSASRPDIDESVPAGPLRVLVVDDQAAVRVLLGELLAADGHVVSTAGSGAEGLREFSKHPFDLVIVDRAMPTLSGDEFAVLIKASAPWMPVIMLTGFGETMNQVGELPPGVDVLLGKPSTVFELRSAIARACRGKRERRIPAS